MTEQQDAHTMQASEELVQTARQLEEARGYARQWSEVADGLREQMLEELGEADALTAVTASGVPVVMISESTRRTFDKERFKIKHPEIDLADFDNITQVRQLRVKLPEA